MEFKCLRTEVLGKYSNLRRMKYAWFKTLRTVEHSCRPRNTVRILKSEVTITCAMLGWRKQRIHTEFWWAKLCRTSIIYREGNIAC